MKSRPRFNICADMAHRLDSGGDVLNLRLISSVNLGLAAAEGPHAGEPVESWWSSCKYVVTLSAVILGTKNC